MEILSKGGNIVFKLWYCQKYFVVKDYLNCVINIY